MSDTSTQVQADDSEVVPILYGNAVECQFDGRWYPEFWCVTDHTHVWDDQRATYVRVPIYRVEPSLVDWYDESRDEIQIHQSHVDAECEWCEGSVVLSRALGRVSTWRRRNGVTLCNYCAWYADTCGNCNGPVQDGDAYEVSNQTWCYGCYENCTYSCEYCDTILPEGDSCDCDDSCLGEMVLSYSTKFHPLFLHTVTDNGLQLVNNYTRNPEFANQIAMGLEFEMENIEGDYATREIAELFRNAYEDNHLMLKQDGSINNGFELVTQPHTLDAFMQHFDWHLIRDAQSKGMRGWDVGSREIGIHIHINRKAFYTKPDHGRYNASPHLMAFMYFIYSNVKSITRIAGRNVHYGHMSKRYLNEAFACARRGASQYSRTYAVNLLNDTTVELRMFRSTMRVERVQAYLQFAEAAVRYTGDKRVEKMRHRFNFADFAEWVSFQPRYQQLHNLIVETDAVSVAPPMQIADADDAEDANNQFMVSSNDNLF